METTTLISFIALMVSVIAIYFSLKNYRDASWSTAIRESYLRFYEMNKVGIANSDVSHIYALPEMYQTVIQEVERANAKLPDDELASLLLKERSLALYIFTVFEEIFQLETQALQFRHFYRGDFYKVILNYFTGRLLQNPRLLYYWSTQGADLGKYFEIETQTYLNEKLGPLLESESFDEHGPFAGKRSRK